MANKSITKQERKDWVAPELRRLQAGAAENNPEGTIGDFGGPGASRS